MLAPNLLYRRAAWTADPSFPMRGWPPACPSMRCCLACLRPISIHSIAQHHLTAPAPVPMLAVSPQAGASCCRARAPLPLPRPWPRRWAPATPQPRPRPWRRPLARTPPPPRVSAPCQGAKMCSLQLCRTGYGMAAGRQSLCCRHPAWPLACCSDLPAPCLPTLPCPACRRAGSGHLLRPRLRRRQRRRAGHQPRRRLVCHFGACLHDLWTPLLHPCAHALHCFRQHRRRNCLLQHGKRNQGSSCAAPSSRHPCPASPHNPTALQARAWPRRWPRPLCRRWLLRRPPLPPPPSPSLPSPKPWAPSALPASSLPRWVGHVAIIAQSGLAASMSHLAQIISGAGGWCARAG